MLIYIILILLFFVLPTIIIMMMMHECNSYYFCVRDKKNNSSCDKKNNNDNLYFFDNEMDDLDIIPADMSLGSFSFPQLQDNAGGDDKKHQSVVATDEKNITPHNKSLFNKVMMESTYPFGAAF